MASSQTRPERQLMRQRGAASRNVPSADFGLSFGAGGSRQDRLQQRQRGAGRKVDNIDFGLSVRAPRSSRSDSRLSNSSMRNGRQYSKTPARNSREPSVVHSLRSESRASAGEPTSRKHRSDELDPQPPKKRRLTTESTGEEPIVNELPQTRLRNRSSRFAIAEIPDEQDPSLEQEDIDEIDDTSALGASKPSDAESDNEKENAVPGDGKPSGRRKKRKSIGQQSKRKKKRPSGDSSTAVQDTANDQRASSSPEPESVMEIEESVQGDAESEAETRNDRTAVQSKPPIRKRRKRKSIVLIKKKRRSSEGIKAQPPAKRSAVPRKELDEGSPSVASPISRNTRLRSPISRSSPIMRSIEVDEASDEEYIDDESPEPPTPAPSKKERRAPKTGGGTSTRTNIRQGTTQSRKNTFPILTHRMTNADALPTIAEEVEEGHSIASDDDTSTAALAISNRTAPNVADVLAQICRETVETTIERMDVEAGSESRALRQRKRSALEAFGADLDTRLFDISAAIEDRLHLEARFRRVKREKADLQAQWIEVRRQRERVALKCDRVRREHWENEQAREDRWNISEAARKVELELERDSSDEDEGLEYLLRAVAEEVTNTHDGGLLNRVKSLNAQLEQMC